MSRTTGAFCSFKSLSVHPDCNTLIGMIFPKSKKVIKHGGDPFTAKIGIWFWYKKGMDGVIAKLLVKQSTCLKIVAAANAGKINDEFKKCILYTVNIGGVVSKNKMRDPKTWHRTLKEKFTKNEDLRKLLLKTKGKRLVEFVRGKHAESNHWGGKLVASSFNGKVCKKMVGRNTMGLYLERVREEMLACA